MISSLPKKTYREYNKLFYLKNKLNSYVRLSYKFNKTKINNKIKKLISNSKIKLILILTLEIRRLKLNLVSLSLEIL